MGAGMCMLSFRPLQSVVCERVRVRVCLSVCLGVRVRVQVRQRGQG